MALKKGYFPLIGNDTMSKRGYLRISKLRGITFRERFLCYQKMQDLRLDRIFRC